MIKLYITISALLLANYLMAQNKVVNVEYEVYFNTEIPNAQKANLYFEQSKNTSIYKKNNSQKNDAKSKRNNEENSVSLKLSSKKQGYNYFDYKKDSLLTFENVFGEDCLISEKIPEIKWTLIDEEKLIDNNKVYKAICYFRGRNYIAWYSLDYPWKYGPWKFQGLPGLIFEISDETKRYNWQIKGITYEEVSDKIFEIDFAGLKHIDIKQYVEKKFNSKELNEKLLSKMPRGTSITNQATPRTGFEIKFEWEE